MTITDKVRAVKKIYSSLDKDIDLVKRKSNIRCPENCNECCTKKGILASPLEFLPLAYFLYQKRIAFLWIEKLKHQANADLCGLYNPFSELGACQYYPYRGFICRLFGFTANTGKKGNQVLIACSKIKTNPSTILWEQKISSPSKYPQITKYSMQLYSIDPQMSTLQLPVNDAIKYALDTMILYFDFKNKKIV
ncbi:MAG: hypothetical protein V2I54_07050 [Bacteroidales bacterium]|jgi:hypothetical protein|nr:hypothetical protein [Bacteroidales bacterium]